MMRNEFEEMVAGIRGTEAILENLDFDIEELPTDEQ